MEARVIDSTSTPRVLVVEDDETQRRALTRILSDCGFKLAGSGNVAEALAHLDNDPVDLVITDLDMPGASGMSLIENVTSAHPDVAVVMVTGRGNTGVGARAIELGAYGYLSKPYTRDDVVVTAQNAIRRRDLERENRMHRDHLEELVRERTAGLWDALRDLERAQEDLRSSQVETIERLARAAEYRDDETARHVDRMSRYCGLLARRAGLDEQESELLRVASVMHDIGKIGIPEKILLAPRGLTDQEFEIMKTHAQIGHSILAGSRWATLRVAADIALLHHERYDGDGYPNGLAGEAIPLYGRIAAIADVFDALTSNRVYRKAFEIVEALNMMRQGSGTHFDPDLLELFFESVDEVLQIKDLDESRATGR